MTTKPSYEQMEQRVRELEKKVTAAQQIQKELRESETLFKTLFEKAPEAIVVIDAETVKFVNANIAASRLFEFTREELIGLGPLDISPPVQPNGRASKELIPKKIQELLSKNPKPFEWVHKNASGKEFLCEIHHSKLTITGRKLYSCIVIDITERRKAETKIKQFQHIIESTNNPIGLVDRNFIYRYANESYSQALNKPVREIIGHSVPEMLGQNFFERVMKNHYERCFTGETISYQAWFELPGWGRRYMDVRYYPFRKPDGQVAAVVTNVHDITEGKQLEIKLKESEERFRAFMDNNPAAIYIKDENDRHIYGNLAALKSVGKNPEEFIGSTTLDLWPPQLADRLIELDRKVIEGKSPKITEEWSDIEKGEKRWRKDIKFPIKLESGEKLLGGIAIDITKRRQAEAVIDELIRFERLISNLSAKFVNLPTGKIDQEINNGLLQIVKTLDLDRSNLFQYSEDKKNFIVTHSYSSQEAKPAPISVIIKTQPWFTGKLLRGEIVRISRFGEMPEDALGERRWWREHELKSAVAVPLYTGGIQMGAISFATMRAEREWSDELVQRFQMIGEVFSNALSRKKTEEALLKSREDFRNLASKLLSVQESERRRLAREMHDDLSQRIAVLAIDIGKIERHYKDMKDSVVENLQCVRERLVKLSGDIHAISRQLHPSILDDLGLVDAVKSECSSFTRREGIVVDYHVERVPSKIPVDIAICIYRVVQEGLRNIVKHSGAEQLQISLTGKDNSIHLMIKDKGTGFDTKDVERKFGLGLVSMQERVRLIRGDISIESQPGKGTVIKVKAPLLNR